MNEAGGLDKVIVDHGWRYTWLGNDPYVFDEQTEYLARISPIVLGGLDTGAPAGSLGEVLHNLPETAGEEGEADAAEPDDGGVTVHLRLLGVRVNVRCAYQECADEIAAFYSASHVPEQASGPEVIVWCETREAGRYLFRSRPDDQAGTPPEGVSVQTLRSPRQPWTSSLPPIPALASWPFKDRFVALHAAAVRLAGGECILIAGDRGSGKTTAALAFAELLAANVLCDETAFIHCRTNVVESFPHAVGVWRDRHRRQAARNAAPRVQGWRKAAARGRIRRSACRGLLPPIPCDLAIPAKARDLGQMGLLASGAARTASVTQSSSPPLRRRWRATPWPPVQGHGGGRGDIHGNITFH